MLAVKRITFLSKDQIVINYTQEDLDPKNEDKFIVKDKSLTIKFKVDANESISNEIEITTRN